MIDQHISISSLVTTPLKKSGNYLIGACPLCGGNDRFNVKDDSMWLCRKCSPDKYQDAITLVMRMQSCDFKTALEYLNIQRQTKPIAKPPQRVSSRTPVSVASHMNDSAWKTDEWQAGADKLVTHAVNALTKQSKAFQYLESRGLEECVIHANGLGFIADDTHQKWGDNDIHALRGILIPWSMPQHYDKYYRLNIRLSPTDTRGKYINIKGGTNHGLYIASPITPKHPVILVESEFDALVITSELVRHRQIMRRDIRLGVVATGSTNGSRLLQWIAMLRMASRVLIAYDSDEAGENASKFWLNAIPNARRLVPTRHDVTDMWKAGDSIVDWIREAVMQ